MASSIWKYATSSLPIIVRAMRDIQPLKFFGGIAFLLFLMGVITLGFVGGWYAFHTTVETTAHGVSIINHKTSPFTSFIPIGGVLITLGFMMFALALLADMLGRHRRISEELLYLARRRIYSNRRTVRASLPPVPGEATPGLSLHDSWCLPVIRSVPRENVLVDELPIVQHTS